MALFQSSVNTSRVCSPVMTVPAVAAVAAVAVAFYP
jgi:hypothetical protein